MTVIVTLFIAGIILLALEVIVPGAILGIVGGVCMLIAVIVAFASYGVEAGALTTAMAVLITGIVLYLEFVLLPKSRLAGALSMKGTVSGRSQPEVADRAQVVGKQAVAVTPLSPSGYVAIGRRRYEAFTRSGHTSAGALVEVVDVDNFRLIVQTSTNTKQ